MKLFRSLAVVPLLAGCFALAAGCEARTVGSGKLASETRAVGDSHAVELAVSGTLDITQGDKEELVVEAEDNILPLIETKVKPDGTLLITFKGNEDIETHKPLSFKLMVKTLDKMALLGSGNIRVAGKLAAEREMIKLPGSGSITVDNLQTGALTVLLEGSGKIKVGGSASNQQVRLEGSGDYEAAALQTDTAKIVVDGSGDCKVRTERTLEVSISGSGEVSYYGHPELRQRVTGSGEVRALGGKES